jgi:hypothetical protein
MVPLTTAASPIAARILAAHLGAEGIVWQLRGDVDGPYPVGPVEVLVPADDLELARELLAAEPIADPIEGELADDLTNGEVPGTTELDSPTPGPSGSQRSRRQLWVAVVGVVLVAAFMLGRIVVLGL